MSLNWVDKIDNVDDIRAEDFNNLVASIEQNKVDKIAGMGLSTNDYTNGDKIRVENSMQFKGEVEETALPTENSVKGDVYKLLKPIAKSYIASSIRYDENVGCYNFFANQYVGLYTEEEYNYMMDNPNGGHFGPEVSCDVYDCDWKYICTKPMSYRDDCGYWCMGDKGELIEGVNYNVVRSDDAVVMDSELNTHEFLVDADSYAIYNGESFDKFYNEETVDKIAEDIRAEKEWKLLGEAEITQAMIDDAGEEGITAIVIDLGKPIEKWYGETWIRFKCSDTKDLNSTNYSVVCRIGEKLEYSESYLSRECTIMKGQSAAYAYLQKDYTNTINLFTNWLNNVPCGTTYQNNGYGASNYPIACYATSNTGTTTVIGKRYLRFYGGEFIFKFPVGTTLKLYGRF